MAEEVTQATDRALDAGASIEDINNIRAKHGLSQFQEVAAVQEPLPNGEEFVEKEEVVPSGPEEWVEVDPQPPTQNVKSRIALDVAARDSAEGKDPSTAFQSIMNVEQLDVDAKVTELFTNTAKMRQGLEATVNGAISEGVRVDPELVGQRLTDIATLEDVGNNVALAKSYVESLPTARNLPQSVKDNLTINQLLRIELAEMSDEIGWNWGTVGDVGGFLVPQENLRYNEVAKVMGVETAAMDLIDYTDLLSRLGQNLKAQTPEVAAQMIRELVNAWPEIHGNNRLALAGLLNDLTGDYSEDWKHIESGFERFDQALLGMGFGKVITGSVKSISALRMASRAKNIEAAADIVTAGVRGQLKEAGVQPIEAAASAMPLDSMNALVKGADNTLADGIRKVQTENAEVLSEVGKINTFGLGLDEAEQVAARNRRVDALNKEPGISNVQVDEIDNTQFKITYDVETEDGIVTRTMEQSYTVDDVKGFVSDGQKGYNATDLGLTSPNFRFVEDRVELVQMPEQMQAMSSKVRKLFDTAIKQSLMPDGKRLSRGSYAKLDELLTMGDENSKVYDFKEAVETGVNGIKLNEAEYKAYVGIRQVVDNLYIAKNKEIVDLWKAQGVKVLDWEGQRVPMKTYSDANKARQGFMQAATKSHWVGVREGDEVTNVLRFDKADEFNQEELLKWYSRGYRLTRVTNNKLLANGSTNLEWALVKADELSEPGGFVLNRRVGYMPKIRKDAHYFVKEVSDVQIGGRTVKGGKTSTIRYFDNRTDADTYLKELQSSDPDGDYRILADRELSASQRDEEYINIAGGLFTGGRKTYDIPFGLPGAKGERTDSLGALQRYVNNISKQIPMSLWRTGMEQRWLNHAKDLGVLRGDYKGSFSDAIKGTDFFDHDHASAKFLRDSHNQISFVSGVPTDAEKAMDLRIRGLAEAAEGIPGIGKVLSRNINNLSLEGVTGTARGITFHTLLGMYNPAQLLIQASGAFVALAINPRHATKGIGQMLAYGVADMVNGTPKQLKSFIKTMEKKGFDMEGYKLWRESGMLENVTHSNLDYYSLWNDAPYDAGVFRRLVGNGDMFFKMGELANSRISFATAYNRWKELNKGKTPTSKDLPTIIARAEQFRLNMSKMNSAKFQTGLSSVPLQFQQVNTKFFEKLFGKGEFTGNEKRRLLAGQAALFGAAGVPIYAAIQPHMLDMLGVDATNTDSETLQLLENGTLGWLVQDYFDINSVVTGRMTLGQDFIENMVGVFTEPVLIRDAALGPFGAVFDRANTAAQRMYTTFSTMAYGDDFGPAEHAAVAQTLARTFAAIPSSSANLIKAYDMSHSNFYKNKDGKPIFEWADMNTQTLIAQGLGFSPQEVADWYEITMEAGGGLPTVVKNADAKRITWLLNEMSAQTDATQAKFRGAAINAIISKYPHGPDRQKLVEQVRRQLKNPTDAWEKALGKVFEEWQSDMQAGLAEYHKHIKVKSNPKIARELEKKGIK